jgi:hypothetical protein
MPIARIITSMPELSGGLVRDLNSRGFEVLILSPEQTISGVADLEIRLDVAGSQQIMADVYANNSLNSIAMQMAAAETDAPAEDIWALLAAFDGDAEKPAEQELAAAGLQQTVEQTLVQSVPVESVESTEDLTSPVLAREETAASVESPIAESAALIPAVEPVSHKASRHQIDPELVPSMFNFSGDDVENDAAPSASIVSAAAGQEEQQYEEKQYLDGNDFRNLVAKKNGSWSFRAPRLVTATGWAAVALLLLFSLMRHHSPMPPDANAGQVPFHQVAPTGSVVPVKSVLITNTGVPIKSMRRNGEPAGIAEDTIVRYNGKVKVPDTEKRSAVKYYTDLD